MRLIATLSNSTEYDTGYGVVEKPGRGFEDEYTGACCFPDKQFMSDDFPLWLRNRSALSPHVRIEEYLRSPPLQKLLEGRLVC